MEDGPDTGAEGTERPVPADGIPTLPPDVSDKDQELRELVDAGAASPEELRALAEKLKEKRSYEESRWREDVRPALMKSKKRRFSIVDLRREPVADGSNGVTMALFLLGAVLLLLLLATSMSFLWLLVPVAAVLVYAWVLGHRPETTTDGTDRTSPDSVD